jgi:hypothetical protein
VVRLESSLAHVRDSRLALRTEVDRNCKELLELGDESDLVEKRSSSGVAYATRTIERGVELFVVWSLSGVRVR